MSTGNCAQGALSGDAGEASLKNHAAGETAAQVELCEITLSISGMFCTHCRDRVERTLRAVPGVRSASVDFARGEALVCCEDSGETLARLCAAVEKAGYGADVACGSAWQAWTRSCSLLVMIFSAWLLLERTGLLTALAPGRTATGGAGLTAMFIAGLATSAHCAAMCGGIALSQCLGGARLSGPLLYNAGRCISYTLGGLILGGLGAAFPQGVSSGAGLLMQGALKVFAGVTMILMGLRMLGVVPMLRRITLFGRMGKCAFASGAPFAVGLLNGLMPCGPLQAAQIAAFASGSAVLGALNMAAFALGTVPLLLILGVCAVSLNKKFLNAVSGSGAVLVCVLGLAMAAQGVGLSGMVTVRKLGMWTLAAFVAVLAARLPLKNTFVRASLAALCCAAGVYFSRGGAAAEENERVFSAVSDGVQTVNTRLRAGSFPHVIVRTGVPVRWVIEANERDINGCNNKIVLPEFGVSHTFAPGRNEITFTPEKSGVFPYSCWMGMIRGTIAVRPKHDS